MRFLGPIACTLLVVPAIASAEAVRPLRDAGTAAYGEFVAGPASVHDLRFARQVLPPIDRPPGDSELAQSRVVYLNKNGVTLQPGANDSRANQSSIARRQTTIPAWSTTATTWDATVACMREVFAVYDVTFTDTDPGQTPHIEAVFGGNPALLEMDNNTGGVSPFTENCVVIENAVVFTFTGALPNDARLACEIMAQEVAHAYGLDHEMLPSDLMTYLDFDGNRAFQNRDAPCGEDRNRPCGINGTTCRPNQNSVKLLSERLGLKGPPPPPTPPPDNDPDVIYGGCSSSSGSSSLAVGLGLLALVRRLGRRR